MDDMCMFPSGRAERGGKHRYLGKRRHQTPSHMRPVQLSVLLSLAFPLCASGQSPRLWGMTTGGGANGEGTIFHVDADGTDFVKVFDFDETSGWGPEGGLCLAANGKLYGTTAHGGLGNTVAGTLFSFDPGGAGFHKIIDFDITNGGGNWGTLVAANDGLLYGAQYMGGGNGGSIYSVDPATDAYTIVHALNTPTDGSGVTDDLLFASDGWLYGTAHYGGAFNSGTIFRFDPSSHTYEKLHDFSGGDGGDTPYGGVCEASNGWFYGTTYTGGANSFGIIYKYDPVNDQFVKLADMDTIPASNCWSSMVNAGPDLLIGTVGTGGQYAHGFLYGVTPSSDVITEVFSFNVANGGNQLGNDIVGSDGRVYGLCQAGGTYGLGTVYGFDATTHAMNIVHSFDLTNDGGLPRGDLTQVGLGVGVEENSSGSALRVWPNPTDGNVSISSPLSWDRGSLLVRNALGELLREIPLHGNHADLSLKNEPPGIYWLEVRSNEGRTVARLVRQ